MAGYDSIYPLGAAIVSRLSRTQGRYAKVNYYYTYKAQYYSIYANQDSSDCVISGMYDFNGFGFLCNGAQG